MTDVMTKAVQETTLGEGFALGLVAIGIDEFNGHKMSIEFAFRHAWRSWDCRRRFPVVQAGPARDDLLRIISKSESRRSPHLSGWLSQWPFRPYVRDGWSLDEVGESYEDSCGIALEAWVKLARDFVANLERDSHE